MLMDDRDPPWIRKNIKGLIHDKKLVYKKHLKKNNSDRDSKNTLRNSRSNSSSY